MWDCNYCELSASLQNDGGICQGTIRPATRHATFSPSYLPILSYLHSHPVLPTFLSPSTFLHLTFRAIDHAALPTIFVCNHSFVDFYHLCVCRQLAAMARTEQRWHLQGKEYCYQMEQDGERPLANAIAWSCGRDAMHLEQCHLSHQFGE